MDIAMKKCMTPKARVSFPHVFEAHAMAEGQEKKFSCVFLFDKKTDLAPLKKAAHNAAVEKWGGDKTKWPKNLKQPFRDGDEKSDLKGYAGTIYVTATSKKRPGVVAADAQTPLTDDVDFYPGCYARATLIAFAYDTNGNKGVSFSLQNIQKLGDGEKFSGRKAASEEFDAVEDGSDDPSNFSSGFDDDDEAGF